MPNDLRAALTAELSTAARKMRKLFDARVRERGLTLTRARTLLLLSRPGPWTQSDLADALDIEQPSVVRLLDGLERQGLIRRTPAEGDRRVKQIELLPLARDQVREIDALVVQMRSVLLRGLTAAEIDIAAKVLRTVSANAEAHGSDGAAEPPAR